MTTMLTPEIDDREVDVDHRSTVYGDPASTYARIAQVWSGVIGHDVTAVQVALCMAGLKLVRASETPDYSDSSDDVNGYVEVFRQIVGPDMIHARSVAEYVALKGGRL
jgi:hypothetical protein